MTEFDILKSNLDYEILDKNFDFVFNSAFYILKVIFVIELFLKYSGLQNFEIAGLKAEMK